MKSGTFSFDLMKKFTNVALKLKGVDELKQRIYLTEKALIKAKEKKSNRYKTLMELTKSSNYIKETDIDSIFLKDLNPNNIEAKHLAISKMLFDFEKESIFALEERLSELKSELNYRNIEHDKGSLDREHNYISSKTNEKLDNQLIFPLFEKRNHLFFLDKLVKKAIIAIKELTLQIQKVQYFLEDIEREGRIEENLIFDYKRYKTSYLYNIQHLITKVRCELNIVKDNYSGVNISYNKDYVNFLEDFLYSFVDSQSEINKINQPNLYLASLILYLDDLIFELNQKQLVLGNDLSTIHDKIKSYQTIENNKNDAYNTTPVKLVN